jgi:hypothetical protein
MNGNRLSAASAILSGILAGLVASWTDGAIAQSLGLDQAIQEQRARAQQSLDEANKLLQEPRKSANQTTPPRVYIYLPTGYSQDQAAKLQSGIEQMQVSGLQLIVPSITPTRNAALVNELRFFHHSEKDEAAAVAKTLSSLVPNLAVEDMSFQYERWSDVRPRRYELWLRSPSAPELSGSIAQVGRWIVGTSTSDCRTKWYFWRIEGDEMVFTDQLEQVDEERILDRGPTGFQTEVTASRHKPGGTSAEVIGQKWEYTFKSTASFAIQRIPSGNGFILTKC